ncbi:MAG: FtsQ-type POTRA domain-containing protein [bacterium]
MKLYQPKKKKKKLGRKIVALAILALIVFGLFKGCQYAVRSIENLDALKITAINVIAPSHIQKAQILSLSGLNKGQGIYNVSLSDAKKRIKGHPWVRKVSIRRSLPSTVEITVQSKEVKALTRVNDMIYYLDNEGKVIDKLIPGFKTNMPVINAKPEEYAKVIALLDYMKNPDISEVFLDGDILTIYLSDENIKILVSISKLDQSLKNIAKVMADLRSNGEKASTMDATLPGNKVVVRGLRK